MNNFFKLLLLSIVMCIIFVLSFFKSPEEISIMLHQAAADNSLLAVINHLIFIIFIIFGSVIKKTRVFLFTALFIILSITATVISVKYQNIPAVIIFITILILSIIAIIKKEVDFNFNSLTMLNKIIGMMAIIFSLYYLHWIKEPIFLNAIIYSPLGIVNCPTLLAFCGLICLLKKPGSILLEFFVASVTLYFGFFGVMRLGAYIDIVLIVAAIYLIVKMFSRLNYERDF